MAARHHALALVLALAACRDDKKAPSVQTIDGESGVLPRVTYAPQGTLATSMRSIEVGGGDRRYLLIEPPGATGKRALVLVFHGDGGTASGFHDGFPFEKASGRDAYVVYPEGAGATWDLETKAGNRDLEFVDALVERLASTFPIDRTRVFAAGYSSGGFFANVLACRRPRLLRAISSSAGGAPYKQAEQWPNGFPKCPNQEPVAAIALHGTSDQAVTLDSGRFTGEYWANVNRCKAGEQETTGYPECRLYRACPTSKHVAFCKVDGLGHWVWDHAAEATWTFFLHQ